LYLAFLEAAQFPLLSGQEVLVALEMLTGAQEEPPHSEHTVLQLAVVQARLEIQMSSVHRHWAAVRQEEI
jgi:hypothetical protein